MVSFSGLPEFLARGRVGCQPSDSKQLRGLLRVQHSSGWSGASLRKKRRVLGVRTPPASCLCHSRTISLLRSPELVYLRSQMCKKKSQLLTKNKRRDGCVLYISMSIIVNGAKSDYRFLSHLTLHLRNVPKRSLKRYPK